MYVCVRGEREKEMYMYLCMFVWVHACISEAKFLKTQLKNWGPSPACPPTPNTCK